MAQVSILYFAALREELGVAEEAVELSPRVQTVGELCDHLAAKYPAYAGRRASVRVARNEAFAEPDERIADGDVIALIPPVAGG